VQCELHIVAATAANGLCAHLERRQRLTAHYQRARQGPAGLRSGRTLHWRLQAAGHDGVTEGVARQEAQRRRYAWQQLKRQPLQRPRCPALAVFKTHLDAINRSTDMRHSGNSPHITSRPRRNAVLLAASYLGRQAFHVDGQMCLQGPNLRACRILILQHKQPESASVSQASHTSHFQHAHQNGLGCSNKWALAQGKCQQPFPGPYAQPVQSTHWRKQLHGCRGDAQHTQTLHTNTPVLHLLQQARKGIT
jgi:hypothetical protein